MTSSSALSLVFKTIPSIIARLVIRLSVNCGMLEHPYPTRSKSRFLRSVEKFPEENPTIYTLIFNDNLVKTVALKLKKHF